MRARISDHLLRDRQSRQNVRENPVKSKYRPHPAFDITEKSISRASC